MDENKTYFILCPELSLSLLCPASSPEEAVKSVFTAHRGPIIFLIKKQEIKSVTLDVICPLSSTELERRKITVKPKVKVSVDFEFVGGESQL